MEAKLEIFVPLLVVLEVGDEAQDADGGVKPGARIVDLISQRPWLLCGRASEKEVSSLAAGRKPRLSGRAVMARRSRCRAAGWWPPCRRFTAAVAPGRLATAGGRGSRGI